MAMRQGKPARSKSIVPSPSYTAKDLPDSMEAKVSSKKMTGGMGMGRKGKKGSMSGKC